MSTKPLEPLDNQTSSMNEQYYQSIQVLIQFNKLILVKYKKNL